MGARVSVEMPAQAEPRDRAEADALVWTFSREKASWVLQADALADDFEGMNELTDEVSRDYAGRFLAELIQNGHDAHPADRTDGQIDIVYEPDEGPAGTLYAANQGRPFSYDDLRSIAVMAKSNKKPGQGIGNKGVGFKSVFLVSDYPEIYSVPSDGRRELSGLCFTFARPADYLAFADGDQSRAEDLRRRRHHSLLPVPGPSRPSAVVRKLVEAGHNVVVRLPIRETARREVEQQLSELQGGQVPMLLFLDRIRRLGVRIGSAPGMDLVRNVEPLVAPDGVRLERIDLAALGSYLCASTDVEPTRFRRAIEQSIDAGRIDARWRTWSARATVSVAVRLNSEAGDDRLYCFLPMGRDAASPFQGHLNAPFSVAIARKALVEDTPLNELLMDVGAEVCCRAATLLAMEPWARMAVADLVAWKPAEVDRLKRAAADARIDLRKLPLFPSLTASGMASIASLRRWDRTDLSVITAPALAAAKATILDPSAGPKRSDRVATFAEAAFGASLVPSNGELSAWTEGVAAALSKEARTVTGDPDTATWLAFYDELAVLARERPTLHFDLATRAIVLADGFELLQCRRSGEGKRSRKEFTVFFRPGSDADTDEDDAADLDPPKSLSARIAFPHPLLRWQDTTQGGRRNRPGRDLLEQAGVVQWRLEDLYTAVASLLASRSDPDVYGDALRFVFQAHTRTERARRADLTRANLLVPSASVTGAWIPAAKARFGRGWPQETLGSELVDFLAVAGDHDEIVALRGRVIAPYDGRRFRGGDQGTWAAFLESAGVGMGLAPDDLTDKNLVLPKWKLRPEPLCAHLDLAGDDTEAWKRELARVPEPSRRSPWTIRTPVRRIPAQGAYRSLSQEARHRFANLVLEGLAAWPADLATFRVENEYWPSPAGSFLRTTAWLPVGRSTERSVRWAEPGLAWHYTDDDGGQPAYADLLDQRIRRRLNGNEMLWVRVKALGVREWGDPEAAVGRLAVLVKLAQAPGLSDAHRSHIRRAYERSWGHVVAMGPAPAFGPGGPPLLGTIRGRLSVPDQEGRGRVYLPLTVDTLTDGLLDGRRVFRLRIEPQHASAALPLLEPALGDRLVRLGKGSVVVSLDGQVVRPRETDPVLATAQRGWLAALLTLTLNLVVRTEISQQSTAKAVSRLRRIRLRYGTGISVSVPHTPLDDPGAPVQVVAVDHERWPTIVLAVPHDANVKVLRWSELETMAPAIAELVGLPSADVPLRFVISKLAPGPGPVSAPDIDDYANALGVRPEQVREVMTAYRDLLDRVAFMLRPVVAYWFGHKVARDLEPTGRDSLQEHEIRALLAKLALPSPWTPETLLERAKDAETPFAMRDAIGIPFVEFNEILEAIGGAYEPDRHVDQHEAAFARWLDDHREPTFRVLRAAALPSFDAGHVAAWYAAAVGEYERARRLDRDDGPREVARLAPDQAWLDEVPVPTPAMIGERVDAWLRALGADPAAKGSGLRQLDRTRTDNAEVVQAVARDAALLITAWTAGRPEEPPAWVDEGPGGLVRLLQARGVLDFRRLTRADVLNWAGRIKEAWPAGMRPTLDPADLGLAQAGLESARQRLAGQGTNRAAARRSVKLGAESVSLEAGDVDRLRHLVEGDADARVGDIPFAVASAGKPPAKPDGHPGPPPTGHHPRISSLTDEQRLVVGFIGELRAYRWLCRHVGVGSVTWHSGLGNHYEPSWPSDDSLGYDLSVRDPGVLAGTPRTGPKKLHVEVKAVGSPGKGGIVQFSLTSREVEVAQQHADADDYFVLLVTNVLSPSEWGVRLLPNPFSTAGRKLFRDLSETRTMMVRLEPAPGLPGGDEASGVA